jgi:hypothetical protein
MTFVGGLHAFYVGGVYQSSLDGSGTWTATNFVSTSDERKKENWGAVSVNFVGRLATVKSGTYDLIEQPSVGRQCGVSGQELQKLLPEAVTQASDYGMLSVNYGKAAMVSCVELAKEVLNIKRQMFALTGGNV